MSWWDYDKSEDLKKIHLIDASHLNAIGHLTTSVAVFNSIYSYLTQLLTFNNNLHITSLTSWIISVCKCDLVFASNKQKRSAEDLPPEDQLEQVPMVLVSAGLLICSGFHATDLARS